MQHFFHNWFGLLAWLTVLAPAAAWDGQEDAAWQEQAEARIAQHRQADMVVTVVDAAGNPVPEARVSLEQTRHAFLFGCNFFLFGRVGNEADEEAYRSQFADLFNYATLGFYWPSYEPRQGEPKHAYTEEVARWCREHGITPKGHPLAWNFTDPGWLPDDTAEIKRLQLERITDCVTRFRGLIDVWDVVNEATHFEREDFVRRAPKMTRMWEESGRIPFVNECFQAARAAHPEATLLINDYRTDEAYVQLIEAMAPRDDKPAYDVIGIQSHMHGGVWPNQKLWEVCERFAPFNVPLHFTELTILSGQSGWERTTPWDSTPEGEERQAEDVRRVYTMLFSHPAVAGITWWDFADRHAWQQAPAGLVGQDLQPKPAYRALKELVRDRWWTRDQATTDADGQASFRGFLGEYLVTVAAGDGRDCEVRLNVGKNAPNQFEVRLP